jgi:RNase P subunit RPR2
MPELRHTGPRQSGYRVHVTCEACGRRHSLERRLELPQALHVHIVCHDCERSLRASVEDGEQPPPEGVG